MKHKPLAAAALTLSAFSGGLASDPALETDADKTLYALGLSLSQQLRAFHLSAAETQIIQRGLMDGLLAQEPQISLQTYGPKIEAFLKDRLATAAETERTAGHERLDTLAAETGAERTDSGLVYVERQAGEGPHPAADSAVVIHYEGKLRDDSVFDSSREAGQPATLQLGTVFPCLTEGLQKMQVGGKATLGCPPDMVYGDTGYPPMIPPGASLLFEVELVGIVQPGEETSDTPADTPVP